MELSHKQERGDSAIDSLEHELYNPKNKLENSSRHVMRDARNRELPTSWGDNSVIITQGKEEGGFSFGAKALIVSLVLLLIAVSVVAWRVVSLRNVVSSANIDMALDVSPYVEGGEAVPLTFTLYNRNRASLLDATLSLEYKKGVGSQDEEEKIYEKREIGIINSNENKRQDYSVVLYGAEAESRDLTLKLEYKVAGSNAIFSKVVTTSTVLKTPQIAVHIDGPETLSVGQNGTFVITVKNNSATTSLPSVLQLTLPNTFTMQSQEPKADAKGVVWNISPLAPGGIATTTIIGSIAGTQGETTVMKALIGSEGNSKTSVGVVYSSHVMDVKLRKSPLNFVVTLETESGAADKIRYGDRSVLTITYVNTSNKAMNDVKLDLSISGEAALYKKINPFEGDYDSIKQTILWNSVNVPKLKSVGPLESGVFRVSIPIVTSGSNSPLLKVNLSAAATAQSKDDVTSEFSKSWVVQGNASVAVKTTYSNSPFGNTGPIPPNANQETTYTAHILVSAQNAVTNAKVTFNLPSYVQWQNVFTPNANISYDQKTRTVTWLIGNIAEDASAVSDIGLVVKPSQSHVGLMPAITSGIIFETEEEVSKAKIRMTLSPLTTYISGESWEENPSRVVDR